LDRLADDSKCDWEALKTYVIPATPHVFHNSSIITVH
jgi:hypothetical protein